MTDAFGISAGAGWLFATQDSPFPGPGQLPAPPSWLPAGGTLASYGGHPLAGGAATSQFQKQPHSAAIMAGFRLGEFP